MPDLAGLTERQITYLACALDAALLASQFQRHGGSPGEELRQLAARISLAVPCAAVKPCGRANLPSLLDMACPQVAAAVKAEAKRMFASRLDRAGAGSASSVTVTLTVREAARLAGVSPQAIRAAAAPGGPLAASKSKVTASGGSLPRPWRYG